MKLAIIAGALAVVLGVLMSIVLLIQPTDIIIQEANVKVYDAVGVNLDTDKIYFGTVSPGGRGERGITIGSEKKRYATIQMGEPLREWAIIQPEKTVFEGNKHIMLSVVVPKSTPMGNYTAPVTIRFYHPLAQYLLP